jgi:hypothetical protein
MQKRRFPNCQWMIASRLRRTAGSSLETRSCRQMLSTLQTIQPCFHYFHYASLEKGWENTVSKRNCDFVGERSHFVITGGTHHCFFFCDTPGDWPYCLATRHSHSVERYKFRVVNTRHVVLGSSWALTTAWTPTSQKKALIAQAQSQCRWAQTRQVRDFQPGIPALFPAAPFRRGMHIWGTSSR